LFPFGERVTGGADIAFDVTERSAREAPLVGAGL
jgi:hypothetical protein